MKTRSFLILLLCAVNTLTLYGGPNLYDRNRQWDGPYNGPRRHSPSFPPYGPPDASIYYEPGSCYPPDCPPEEE